MVSNFKFWESNQNFDDNPFLVTEEEIWSYSKVFEKGDSLFASQTRDVLLLLTSKNIDTVVVYIGAIRNGIVPLLVDEDIKEEALKRILDSYLPKYIFHKNSREIPSIENVQEIIPVSNESKLTILKNEEKEIFPELGVLLLTSGSTGDPKSVRLTLENFNVVTRSIVEYLELSSSRRAISLLPLHYSYGLSVLHNTMFVRGSIFLTDKSILDKDLFDEILRFKITDISGVPFIIELFSRMKLDSIFHQLQCVTQAGGRLASKYTKKMLQISKEFNFKYFTMYGQTEAAPRISYVPYEQADNKLGYVGIPVSCGKVHLECIEPNSQSGELIYTGSNVCLGYALSHKDLLKGDELLGSIRTGDMAFIDEDGYIKLLGRIKRFIKLKGISVNLDHVEELIRSAGINGVAIGEDDNLIIVLEDLKQSQEELSILLKQNFNLHPSLISFKQHDILLLASGKPDYLSLKNLI